MRLVLIRHGKTNANEMIEKNGSTFYIGCLNNELSDLSVKGIEMAKSLLNNRYVKQINRLYVSDLKRAIDTAKYARPDLKYIIDKRIRERSLGEFEGKTREELMQKEEYKKYFSDPKYMDFRMSFKTRAPGAENYTDVVNRCMEFLKEFDYTKNETIGVVSHQAAIRCMMFGILNIKPQENIFKLKIHCVPYVFEGDSINNLKLISHNIDALITL